MEGHSKLKYFFVTIGIALLFVGSYFMYQFVAVEKPYKVENLGNATDTLSKYKTPPPGFPKEVILENKTLSQSSTIVTSAGNASIVMYISDKNIAYVLKLYMKNFPKIGWIVVGREDLQNSAKIQVTKNNENIKVTLTKIEDSKTNIEFQYSPY